MRETQEAVLMTFRSKDQNYFLHVTDRADPRIAALRGRIKLLNSEVKWLQNTPPFDVSIDRWDGYAVKLVPAGKARGGWFVYVFANSKMRDHETHERVVSKGHC